MKHLFIITFLGSFLFLTNLCAAAPSLDDLLNIKNHENTQGGIYKGTPFVYIDTDKDAALAPQKFEPLPYQPSYTFDIKTPFGQKSEASFVPHTTDFADKVQVLSNGDVVVEETIQFVNTRHDYAFERLISKTNGQDLTFIKATLNNRPVALNIKNNETSWILSDKQILTPGVHTYVLTYLLKNAVKSKGQIAALNLSLTGPNWGLPIERFSAVVLFPQKTPLFKKDVLFGANKVKIPETTDVYTDENGNFFLTLNRPLPAFADINIDLDFDKKALSGEPFWDVVLNQAGDMLFLIGLGILILYALATALFLKLTKSALYPVKELSAYSYLTLRYISGNAYTYAFIRRLKSYYAYKNIRAPFFKGWAKLFSKEKLTPLMSFAARVFAVLNIMYKYILMEILILTLIIWQAQRVQMPLSSLKISILIGVAVISLFFIYFKAEKPFIKRETTKFLDNAFSTDIGFGLSGASIQALFVQFYPIMLALDQQNDWMNYVKQYNINFTGLTFLEEKETSQ